MTLSRVALRGRRAIENGFPFALVSQLAEAESWRKEVYRPVTHLHKWWAQRLGSVFRAAILAATAPAGVAIMDGFYAPIRLPGVVVFDPFMGSGTTVVEAHKLGCTAIGRDLNPVPVRALRAALGPTTERDVRAAFQRLDAAVGARLRALYRARDSRGREADVLYFFWVKRATCPACRRRVRLFSTQILARHAYPGAHPRVHVVCPDCGDVFPARITDRACRCPGCAASFDPHRGAAGRRLATCRNCGHAFAMAPRRSPPAHDLYAKLVLTAEGNKEYLRATPDDRARYATAARRLRPSHAVAIRDGYNTRQLLHHGYREWSHLFNARQLLALTTLARAIQQLPHDATRDAFATLFSGTLEFNNLLASFKGEGTGAVRPLFSHHVLKPERMPIEANPWGTAKSSGAFCTLFETRLVRALRYRTAPFELAVDSHGTRKVFGLSPPMDAEVRELAPGATPAPGGLYLSCGDSAATGLPTASVDLVLTDPPFFDNVHYSELADFFFVWQERFFGARAPVRKGTTRSRAEVQDTDAVRFACKLEGVFAECARVLKDEGLLVFSYHHSRDVGWSSVARAALGAGFAFVAAQPVKAELSAATPKRQAKEPIDLDVLLVCRKRERDRRARRSDAEVVRRTRAVATQKVRVFHRSGRRLSRNDVRVVVLSQLLVDASPGRDGAALARLLVARKAALDLLIERLWAEPGG
jgi:putative DNA methylase